MDQGIGVKSELSLTILCRADRPYSAPYRHSHDHIVDGDEMITGAENKTLGTSAFVATTASA